MIFKPEQEIKQLKCRICKFEDLYFAKQPLRRLWRYVTRLFRFYNTFEYTTQCCVDFCTEFEPKGQNCPVLRDQRWVRDCHLRDTVTALLVSLARWYCEGGKNGSNFQSETNERVLTEKKNVASGGNFLFCFDRLKRQSFSFSVLLQ